MPHGPISIGAAPETDFGEAVRIGCRSGQRKTETSWLLCGQFASARSRLLTCVSAGSVIQITVGNGHKRNVVVLSITVCPDKSVY
mmetsp:Transcript_1655/g.3548  ORF Transcript_1655/g.3548 Transcript_1655/m.3548 type:complete len:85 (-) Transcript_1655:381-635(-)